MDAGVSVHGVPLVKHCAELINQQVERLITIDSHHQSILAREGQERRNNHVLNCICFINYINNWPGLHKSE